MPCDSAKRVALLRARRLANQALATITLERDMLKKLSQLGYLDPRLVNADKGPAIDKALRTYVLDKLAEEP